MANPQPTDAHLRMAHSINEAIMLRDFTKRQRKILDLILRLSWGCGKKFAYIPRQEDFEVVGILAPHIKQELDWLETSQIINRDGPYYWFNKDFDQWQISRVHTFAPEQLTDLVSLNLNGSKPEVTEMVTAYPKLHDFLTKVTETVSGKLPKQELGSYQNSNFPTPNLASPKEILNKYIYDKNIDTIDDHTLTIEHTELTETVTQAREVWGKALVELKGQVNAPNYRTWLKNSAGVFIDGNILVVGVSSLHVLEYLVKNQRSLIEKVLMGLGDYKIKFVIQEANNDTD